jgi:N-acetylglutamate synthase-like GNAT family acetyltransferase
LSRLILDFLDSNSAEAAELARLHAEEWQHLYREWDERTAREEFRTQSTDGSLPATLVLREDGQLIGSVSVVRDDCEARTDLAPWLASLCVLPGKRGRGHGSRLIDAAIDLAKRNKAPSVYVFTESAAELFLRHGFVHFADAVTNGCAVTILRREI